MLNALRFHDVLDFRFAIARTYKLAFDRGEDVAEFEAHPIRLFHATQSLLDYAREELVAEIGSALDCADLGLALEPREDHAAYLDFWLRVLKEDSRAVFQAAAHAQRAADLLNGLQPDT